MSWKTKQTTCRWMAAILAFGLAGSAAAQESHQGHESEAAVDGASLLEKLSPEVRSLLLAEMGELSGAVREVAAALAIGDWPTIREAGHRMHESYVMKRSLTEAQAAELGRVLPADFKRMDGAFHQRARQLAMAAETHDRELVMFRYSRLLEACGDCHQRYASERFPGLNDGSSGAGEHRH